MAVERMLAPEIAEALRLLRADLETPVARHGNILEVFLPYKGNPVPVAHGLPGVPDGYTVHLSVGGGVVGARVPEWTAETAWLAATENRTVARVSFHLARSPILAVSKPDVGLIPAVAPFAGTVPWANVDKTGSSLADLVTKSAAALTSGTLAEARLPTSVQLARKFDQSFVDLTNSFQSITGSGAAQDLITFVRVNAPSGDRAQLVALLKGGLGIVWSGGWLTANGFTASNTVAFTMAGSAAEDYTLHIEANISTIQIRKTGAGTLTGTTRVIVHQLRF